MRFTTANATPLEYFKNGILYFQQHPHPATQSAAAQCLNPQASKAQCLNPQASKFLCNPKYQIHTYFRIMHLFRFYTFIDTGFLASCSNVSFRLVGMLSGV
jgi:hypothetical protein